MDSVVQLVNRLQSAATLLGDNAASAGDKSLPSLWDLLPSIVVIGGQVRPRCEGAAAALAVAQDARCGSGFPALTAPRPARAELGQELGAGGGGRQGLPAARHGDRHAPPARAAARAPGRPGGARVWRVPAQQSREDVQLWCARTPRPAPRCARALQCLRAAAPRARSQAARMRACPSIRSGAASSVPAALVGTACRLLLIVAGQSARLLLCAWMSAARALGLAARRLTAWSGRRCDPG